MRFSRVKSSQEIASNRRLARTPRSGQDASSQLKFEKLEHRVMLAFETPLIDVAGIDADLNPPDTVGDVGPNHYVQMVNASFYQIYDKSGAIIQPSQPVSSLGSGDCAAGFGDPIVLYDGLADRWLLSEFGPNNTLCMYISQTPDPTGGYFEYQFVAPDFPDYPKYAVHADGYFATTNESVPAIYAFDRTNMLAGAAARPLQRFTAPPLAGFAFQALTPADLDGPAAPEGSPAIFMRQNDDEAHNPGSNDPTQDFLEMWELNVDFDNAANSTFTGPTSIGVSEFDSDLCGLIAFACFPQPGSAVTLDPLREVIMHRLQYRNFGTHETLVGNFVTDIDGNDHGGVRWFELRSVGGGPWTVHQEGTVAPDGDHRWMGAIAMNGRGDIALMYNVSSTTTSPSIRYIGRQVNDPLGTMPRGEFALPGATGSGFNGSNRWGDYSAMSVDPVDDSTFWFTGMYTEGNGTSDTRIGVVAFEVPAIEFGITDGSTQVIEGGLTDTYTMSLLTDPTGPVTLRVTADGETEVSLDGTTFFSNVTFTRTNMSPQTITVRGIEDGVEEGTHISILSHDIIASSDPNYPTTLQIPDLEVTVFEAIAIGETGTATVGKFWQTIALQNTYFDPIVVAGPAGRSEAHPLTLRVRNVASETFDIRVQEWAYLDGNHGGESVGYFVIEAGTHQLNGLTLIAGRSQVNHQWSNVTFDVAFTGTPVVLSQVSSFNGGQPVVTRTRNVDQTGFQIRLQEEEAADGKHNTEWVNWIAVDATSGLLGGLNFESVVTGEVVNHNGANFGFVTNFDNAPVLLANMQTFIGHDPANLRLTSLDESGTTLFVEEERSRDAEVAHVREAVGYLAIQPGMIAVRNVIGESGSITAVNREWQTVQLRNVYNNPVVIISPPSFVEFDPTTVRVRNVTSKTFQVHIEEWNYLDLDHADEKVDYLVVEAGIHRLNDGTIIVAGNAQVDDRFTNVNFGYEFDTTPIVLSQVNTDIGRSTVATRNRDVTTSGFRVRLQEEEAADGRHIFENVAWFAIEPGIGRNDGMDFEAIFAPSAVNHNGQTIPFNVALGSIPNVFADFQSYFGNNPATLRYTEVSNTAVSMFVEEETSADAEILHIRESVGLFVINDGDITGLTLDVFDGGSSEGWGRQSFGSQNSWAGNSFWTGQSSSRSFTARPGLDQTLVSTAVHSRLMAIDVGQQFELDAPLANRLIDSRVEQARALADADDGFVFVESSRGDNFMLYAFDDLGELRPVRPHLDVLTLGGSDSGLNRHVLDGDWLSWSGKFELS